MHHTLRKNTEYCHGSAPSFLLWLKGSGSSIITKFASRRSSRSNSIERILDRYIGIPLVFFMGMFRRRRLLPVSPDRIGLIQPTGIGDMILVSGLILHLRQCFPRAEIHIFHGATNAAATQFLPIDIIGHCCVFKRPWTTLKKLRTMHLDVVINCAPWARLTAVIAAMSGARAVVCFKSSGQFIHLVSDVAVPYLDNRHETENHRAVAEQFGPLQQYKVCLRRVERPPRGALPYRRLVLMHLAAGGSRAMQKSWLISHWGELARRLVAKGWIIGFTGLRQDLEIIRAVTEAGGLTEENHVKLADYLTLTELAYVVVRARLLVSVDTGVAHFAAGLGAKVIGLYGPTSSWRWGAFNNGSIGLDAPHPAAGHIHLGFERHPQGNDVMASLSVDTVFSAVEMKLNEVDSRAVYG